MTEQEAIKQVRILTHGESLYKAIRDGSLPIPSRLRSILDQMAGGDIVYEDAIAYLRQIADTLEEAIDYSSILAAFKRVIENHPISLKTRDGLGAYYMAVGRLLQLLDHESLEFYERLDDERQAELNGLFLHELMDHYGIEPDIQTMEASINIK